MQIGPCVVHISNNCTVSSNLSSLSPPLWCIFNIAVIAQQPEMSHLGTPPFPLHLCLLFKDANSPSSSSSASLLLWILRAMLISPVSQQLPQHPTSKGWRLCSLTLHLPIPPHCHSWQTSFWRAPWRASLARCLLQMINVECVNLRFG